jgi:hypothetical protein
MYWDLNCTTCMTLNFLGVVTRMRQVILCIEDEPTSLYNYIELLRMEGFDLLLLKMDIEDLDSRANTSPILFYVTL